MFVRKQGKTKFMWFPVTVSTTFSKGGLVALSSGQLIEATTTTAAEAIIGVIRHAIAATDTNYAVARMVEVEVPVELNVVWTADVTATLATTDVGTFCDLTSNLVVNRAASTYDIAMCTRFLTTTKGEFVLNIGCLASTT